MDMASAATLGRWTRAASVAGPLFTWMRPTPAAHQACWMQARELAHVSHSETRACWRVPQSHLQDHASPFEPVNFAESRCQFSLTSRS